MKSISLTQRLFDLRVDLAIALQHEQFQNDEVAKALHDEVMRTATKTLPRKGVYVYVCMCEGWAGWQRS